MTITEEQLKDLLKRTRLLELLARDLATLTVELMDAATADDSRLNDLSYFVKGRAMLADLTKYLQEERRE